MTIYTTCPFLNVKMQSNFSPRIRQESHFLINGILTLLTSNSLMILCIELTELSNFVVDRQRNRQIKKQIQRPVQNWSNLREIQAYWHNRFNGIKPSHSHLVSIVSCPNMHTPKANDTAHVGLVHFVELQSRWLLWQ